MKIALAQLNPKIGDFDWNLSKALAVLESTRSESPDIVVFSELYLMGYPPHDYLEKPWFVKRQLDTLDRLAKATEDYPETGVIVGAALPSDHTPGHGLYNAAVLIHNGRIVFSQAKTLLPTYDVFDEARYFDPGSRKPHVFFQGSDPGSAGLRRQLE